MAWQRVTFRSELDPVVRKELDRDNARLRGWQSKEHNADGSHGHITADEITIKGDPPEIVFIERTPAGETNTGTISGVDGYLVVSTEFGDIHIGQRPVSLVVAGGTRFAGIVFDPGDDLSGGGTTISYGFGSATSTESSPPSDAFGLYDVTNAVPLLRVWRDFASIGAANYMIAPDGAHAAPSTVYLGDRNSSLTRFVEVAAGTLYGAGGVQERGRTVSMGDWTTPTFAAGNFTGNNAMTWTVAAQAVLAYTLIGNTMTLTFNIVGTVGGTPSTLCRILIPAGKTATKTMRNPCRVVDATAGPVISFARALAGGTTIDVALFIDGTGSVNWAAGANEVDGQITFEVDP